MALVDAWWSDGIEVTGKGDITVITAGLLIVFSGVYVLSLVKPASKQFIGAGWPEKFCRILGSCHWIDNGGQRIHQLNKRY